MKIYDYYIIILASLLLATVVILAALDETRLDFYFSVCFIETLVLNELCIYFNPETKKKLNIVNYILFAGFLFIVMAKVVEILWGIDMVETLRATIKLKMTGTL